MEDSERWMWKQIKEEDGRFRKIQNGVKERIVKEIRNKKLSLMIR